MSVKIIAFSLRAPSSSGRSTECDDQAIFHGTLIISEGKFTMQNLGTLEQKSPYASPEEKTCFLREAIMVCAYTKDKVEHNSAKVRENE